MENSGSLGKFGLGRIFTSQGIFGLLFAKYLPLDFPSDNTDINTNQLTPETKINTAFKKSQQKFKSNLPKISSLPRKQTAKIQPRGEGYRIKYRVINKFLYSPVFQI